MGCPIHVGRTASATLMTSSHHHTAASRIGEPRLNPQTLPRTPLYGAQESIGWPLSPTPWPIPPDQMQSIQRLGPVLWRFSLACEQLYRKSRANQSVPPWVADLIDTGKPPELIKLATMKRFRNAMPRVIRPDLLLTETGWMLVEVDSVPGGLGFTAALNQAYRESGFSVIEPDDGLPTAFLRLLRGLAPTVPDPVIVVAVSDEAADYRRELQWLVDTCRATTPNIHLVHPRDLDWRDGRLVLEQAGASPIPIDVLYRFFELFDLDNIPRMPLIQYAIRKGAVVCTPPFKPQLEEKAWLALLHHPVLALHWRERLGDDDFEWLKAHVPHGWMLDPDPLPPQAVIPGLTMDGTPLQAFAQLGEASQKARQLVIKPSGFSPLAWGSRGVSIGHDMPTTAWQAALRDGLQAFGTTPHLLQEYHKPVAVPAQRLDPKTGAVRDFQGRVRLCPYYMVIPDAAIPLAEQPPELVGLLATICPADKKIIHGMDDGIMTVGTVPTAAL